MCTPYQWHLCATLRYEVSKQRMGAASLFSQCGAAGCLDRKWRTVHSWPPWCFNSTLSQRALHLQGWCTNDQLCSGEVIRLHADVKSNYWWYPLPCNPTHAVNTHTTVGFRAMRRLACGPTAEHSFLDESATSVCPRNTLRSITLSKGGPN